VIVDPLAVINKFSALLDTLAENVAKLPLVDVLETVEMFAVVPL
jgi:hypothetical protein